MIPLRRQLLRACRDLYHNSLALGTINTLLGLLVLGVLWLAPSHPAYFVLLILAGPMLSWLYAAAAIAVRGGAIRRAELSTLFRAHARRGLALGAASLTLITLVLLDLQYAIRAGGLVPYSFGIAALWLGAIAALLLVLTWAASAAHPDQPLTHLFRRAATSLAAAPARCLGLGALVTLLLSISTVLIAPLLTITPALVALLTIRVIDPPDLVPACA